LILLKINRPSLRLGPAWFAKMRLNLSPFINMDLLKGELALASYFFRIGRRERARGARRPSGSRQFNGVPLLIANR
jgi:hypothetical protein